MQGNVGRNRSFTDHVRRRSSDTTNQRVGAFGERAPTLSHYAGIYKCFDEYVLCYTSNPGGCLLKRFNPDWFTRCEMHALPVGMVLLATAIAYPMWTHAGFPAFDDLTHLNIPQRMFVAWAFRHKQLPLWNPFNFAGQPLLAAGQSGPLYLPNVVYMLFSAATATKVSYLLHVWFAAIGMYALLWALFPRRSGAVVGAVAFCTSGFLVGHQVHTQMFDAFTWLPWLTLLTVKLLRGPTPRYMIAFAFALAGEIYAGHPQITFYIGIYVLGYIALDWLQNPTYQRVQAVISIVVASCLGILLSASQWLPTLTLVKYSTRATADASFVLSGSMPPIGLTQFLMPFAAGGGYTGKAFSSIQFAHLYHTPLYWELFAYIGLFAFVFAVAVSARFTARDGTIRIFTILSLLFTCFALGANTDLATLLVHLPGFNLFRIPARYIGLTDFSLSILAGLALNKLSDTSTSRSMRRSIFWVAIGCILLIVILSITHKQGELSETYWIPIFLLFFTAVFMCVQRQWWTKRLSMVFVAFMCTDSLYTTQVLAGFVLAPTANYEHPSQTIQYLRAHPGQPFPFARVAAWPGTTLSHDESLAYRIPTLDGYDSLEPSWYATNIDLTWQPETLQNEPRSLLDAYDVQYVVTPSDVRLPDEPLANVATTTWDHWFPALSSSDTGISIDIQSTDPKDVTLPPYGPLFSVTLESQSRSVQTQVQGVPGTAYIVSIPANWPRNTATHIILRSESWFVPFVVKNLQFITHQSVLHRPIAVHATLSPRPWTVVFEDNTEIIWKNPDRLAGGWITKGIRVPYPPMRTDAELVHTSLTHSVWRLHSSGPSWFILSQTFDPGWHASIDGHPVRPSLVDDGLTGVKLPATPGVHTITFDYRPISFYVGLALGAMGGILMILWMFWLRLRR